MRKHCGSEYFVSTMLLAKTQNNFLPMHKHATEHQSTFTYVISSNYNKPNTDILVETKDNQTLTLNYPDAKEFFTLIDTGLMHGTQTQSDDNNYYLYFVFDGVTVTNPSLEFHKIYIV